jgi:hypothetical protein
VPHDAAGWCFIAWPGCSYAAQLAFAAAALLSGQRRSGPRHPSHAQGGAACSHHIGVDGHFLEGSYALFPK